LIQPGAEITPQAIGLFSAYLTQFDQSQESGNVGDIKAWIMQFVFRIKLGYNTAKIFYTYPMTDLFNSRNTVFLLGGISFPKTANG
jgi:hypothetical protein